MRVLAEASIDCDVIPYDRLLENDPLGAGARVENGRLFLGPGEAVGSTDSGRESYRALVLPWVQAIPAGVLSRLVDLAGEGLPVYFLKSWPERPCSGGGEVFQEAVERLKNLSVLCNCSELGRRLRGAGLRDFLPDAAVPLLRHLHYRKDGTDIYFLFNEDVHRTIDTWVTLHATGTPECWDPLTGRQEAAVYEGFEKQDQGCPEPAPGTAGIPPSRYRP
ncbi:MAG: hypothetical protein HYY08_00940, partial [Firmicutes bacterium]|nr:hypothetical protein [Bacillota bacterium]